MEAIRVVLGKPLLRAADRAARRLGQNRSALIRDALRSHLERLGALDRQERDRRGYECQPDSSQDAADWERTAKWPGQESAARLSPGRMGEVCAALSFALGCDSQQD